VHLSFSSINSNDLPDRSVLTISRKFLRMNLFSEKRSAPFRAFAVLIMLCVAFAGFRVDGQPAVRVDESNSEKLSYLPNSAFRVERLSMPVGAELITILSRRVGISDEVQGPGIDVPLVSILRDTLGDDIPENDRLRYVWVLSYTKPTLGQRAAAFVPFLYSRTTLGKVGSDPPPYVLDIQPSDRVVWNKVFWFLFKRLVVGEFSVGARASALQYRQNSVDHRRMAVADALAALALFQEVEGHKVLSRTELADIQARLALTEKPFGWRMPSENLGRVYEKHRFRTRDDRNQNWELLRQYTESQGLLFEPLEMEDGYARHAIVWTSEEDIRANKGKTFQSRFLNIKNPWRDRRLENWSGYKQVRWFDADDREVEPETPGATKRTMIPLALYGLDHPKVPMILVDFRDTINPKRRELSRRVLTDVADNVLAGARFHGFAFFLGRFIYDFVAGRRGMDLNQASRFRSYSQLRLLLALDHSLDPELRNEVTDHVNVAVNNPLDRGIQYDTRVSLKQYENLIAYANRPDGLPKKIYDDRREEMVRLKHSRPERVLLTAASVFTLGLYRHRETPTPSLIAEMDERRQLDFHERFIKQTAFASVGPEIDTDMEQLQRSLKYVALNGSAAEKKTTRALAKIFSISRTEETRLLCLAGLYKINNSSAKKELLAIYRSSGQTEKMRGVSARYLKLAVEEGQRISTRDLASISAITDGALH
jgi:hypothetical protein